jgi:Tol biopolymer transport system component
MLLFSNTRCVVHTAIATAVAIGAAPNPLSAQTNASGDTARLFMPGAVSTELPEFAAAMAPDGNTFLFNRTSADRGKIYLRSIYRNGRYEKTEKLILHTDTASIANPAIAPDESALVFWSTQLGGQGGTDLFVCYRQTNGSWSKPQALPPPFNSAYGDFAPAFSPDGKTLFFASERPGVVRDFPKDIGF